LDREFAFRFWDLAGVEQYHTIGMSFTRKANLVLLVFSVCDASFDPFPDLRRWHEDVKSEAQDPEFVLVGTHIDQEAHERWGRRVTYESATALARELKIQYFEVSGVTGEGVTELFEYATARCARRALSGPQSSSGRKEVGSF
jgi:GTPase SAR1 family protein